MKRWLWVFSVATFLWGTAHSSPQDELQQLLTDKVPVAEGICYVRGNVLIPEGTPYKCFIFTSPTNNRHIWFVIVDGLGALYVFQGDITNASTQLIWWRDKRDT